MPVSAARKGEVKLVMGYRLSLMESCQSRRKNFRSSGKSLRNPTHRISSPNTAAPPPTITTTSNSQSSHLTSLAKIQIAIATAIVTPSATSHGGESASEFHQGGGTVDDAGSTARQIGFGLSLIAYLIIEVSTGRVCAAIGAPEPK